MKKATILLIVALIPILALAGCSGQPMTSVPASSGLSTATRLAAGTLKLQDTNNAISSSQASELLTLWEAYQSMNNSDTTSHVELDALEHQIESSLTAEQLQAIDDMGLTEQSVSELLQSSLSEAGSSGSSTTNDSSASSTTGGTSGSQGAASVSQDGGPGGMPAGAQGAPGPAGISQGGDSLTSTINGDGTSAQSTPAETQSISNPASAKVSPMLVQAVIQMLENLSQAPQASARGAASVSQASRKRQPGERLERKGKDKTNMCRGRYSRQPGGIWLPY